MESILSTRSKEPSNTKYKRGANFRCTRLDTSLVRKGAHRCRALSRSIESPPPSGMTNAVAFLRSGLGRTSVTVMDRSTIAGSLRIPRPKTSASAWRSSSPTRSWRWLASLERRFIGFVSASTAPTRYGGSTRLQGPRDFLHLEGFNNVTHLNVLVVLDGHTAFLPGADFSDVVLEVLQ